MNLKQTLLLSGDNLPHGGTPVGFKGKKFRVIDYPGYGDQISEHDKKEDADRAADARPYSKVVKAMHCFVKKEGSQFCVHSHQTGKNFGCYPSRGAAKERLAQIHRFKATAAPTEKSSLFPRDDENDTPVVRDVIRRRRVRTNPLVD